MSYARERLERALAKFKRDRRDRGNTEALRILGVAAIGHLGALLAEGGWQPIESVPRDGTAILLAFGDKIERGSWDSGCAFSEVLGADGCWDLGGRSVYGTEPSAWMPLPEPPQ